MLSKVEVLGENAEDVEVFRVEDVEVIRVEDVEVIRVENKMVEERVYKIVCK